MPDLDALAANADANDLMKRIEEAVELRCNDTHFCTLLTFKCLLEKKVSDNRGLRLLRQRSLYAILSPNVWQPRNGRDVCDYGPLATTDG